MKAVDAVLACVLISGLMSILDAGQPQRPTRPTVRGQISKAVNLIEKEIKDLQKELEAAQEEYPKTQLDLHQAYESYKQAKKELQEQEKSLQSRLGTKAGLTDAIGALEKAEEDYDRAVSRLTEELKGDMEFQSLLEDCEKTEAKLEQLKKNNPQAKDSKNDSLRNAAKASLKAREALKNRLDGDSKVKPALEAKRQAETAVKNARKEFDKAAKSDPDLRRAEKYQRQTRDEWRQAQQTATKLEAKIAAIQQQIAIDRQLIGK